jgi:hypothetical protein
MKIIDRDHPFYKPLWRRVVLCCVLASWVLMEIVARDAMWMIIAGALFVVCVWQFLITWPKSGQQS